MSRVKPSDSASPRRAWQRMLSGRRLDLLDPSPLDIEVEDIAHGLARVSRWNGQTIGPCAFSVAQHCLVVDQILVAIKPSWSPAWYLAGLLHDAPEYVVGDLISPFKAALGYDYKAFELRLLSAIHQRFGLPVALPDQVQTAIKKADRIAAYFEATTLAGFTKSEAAEYFGTPLVTENLTHSLAALEPWSAGRAQQAFLDRVALLTTPNARTSPQSKLPNHKNSR
jgi:uncharacterized protein